MTSISVYERSAKRTSLLNVEDRISSLPDSVLVHILSLIPTKYAVRTSILSSRWKHQWTYVPKLDFDHEPPRDSGKRHLARSRFMRFIDRVLLLHRLSCIKRFSLSSRQKIDLNRLNTWITVAISRSVEELHIQIDAHRPLHLPSELFTCKSLVVLKLCSQVHVKIPNSVSFPSLKNFEVFLKYPSNLFTSKLSSICPALEDLFIRADLGDNVVRTFIIHTSTLKFLKLDFFAINVSGDKHKANEIVINAPSLEYLSLKDDHLNRYLLKNLSSLVNANISCGDCCHIKYVASEEPAKQYLVFLKEIFNVKYLRLGPKTMGVLNFAYDDDYLPSFQNLTHLEVNVSKCYGWRKLPHLLKNMPNLVKLELEKDHDNHDCDVSEWIEPNGVATCLLLNLKEIRVYSIMGYGDLIELIKYFLENTEVLIKMEIGTRGLADREEFFKKIAMFRRGSRTCEIQFY